MIRLPPVLGLVLAVLAAASCVRLGFWQLSRLDEKKALNAALAVALSAPPTELPNDGALPASAESLRVHRYAVSGAFDARCHILLVSRSRDGEPGVDVVTPLVPDGGGPLVLVDRGFLPSADGATANATDLPEPAASAVRRVVGFVEPMRSRGRPGFLHRVVTDSMQVWNAPWIDADSVAAALGQSVRAFVLRELPGPGVPDRPSRAPARRFDESIHVNYAVQWFSFAAIILIGSAVLFVRSRRIAPTSEISP